MEMFIECLGASREVGRSAFLVHTDKNVMLDYGIKLFDESGRATVPLETPIKPDFEVLSHAHMDHSGCLPMLYRNGNIRWYSTPPTKDICQVLWQDSMKIMGPETPYTPSQYKKSLKYWSPLFYNQAMHTGDTKVKLLDAGHIAGSAMVEIEHREKVLLYTGDFKCENTHMHKGAKFQKDVDVLVMETTYAKKEHPPRKQAEMQLMKEIHSTVEDGGNVLLPSFSLGRTQELIALIRQYDRDVPVYVDGMGREMTNIYLRHSRYIRDPDRFRKDVRSVLMVQSIPDKRMATRKPSVIISTAGMMNGGPVLSYLFNLNSRSRLIFTGYCVEDTNGWKLQNKGYITKDGQDLSVDLPVDYIDLSAHAGRADLLEFIKCASPRKIVLVHGDKPEEFAQELKEKGYDAAAPLPGERVML
jgi:putative mRNA 3-end processing factor